MTKQKRQRNNHTGTNQNTLESFPHLSILRALAELFEKCALVGRRNRLVPLPFAYRDGVNSGKLGEFNLVKTELSAQFLDVRCVQTLIF